MKKLEKMKKKELIEYITRIRPKADAYDRVCKQLGIENNILGFVKNLTIPDVNHCEVCDNKKEYYHKDLKMNLDCPYCNENSCG